MKIKHLEESLQTAPKRQEQIQLFELWVVMCETNFLFLPGDETCNN